MTLRKRNHHHQQSSLAVYCRAGSNLCPSSDIGQNNILHADGEFPGTESETPSRRTSAAASSPPPENLLTAYIIERSSADSSALTSARATSSEQHSKSTNSCGVPFFRAPSNNAISSSPSWRRDTTTLSNSTGSLSTGSIAADAPCPFDSKHRSSADHPAVSDQAFQAVNGRKESRGLTGSSPLPLLKAAAPGAAISVRGSSVAHLRGFSCGSERSRQGRGCSPPLFMGEFCHLVSGGPEMLIVDISADDITVSWNDGADTHTFSRSSVRRSITRSAA